MSEEIRSSSAKKSSSGRSRSKDKDGGGGGGTSSKDDKIIDNIKLASLLRESAEVVERGEFDAILYEALTDFRVYYKQKYPKTSTKSKKTKPSKKKSHDKTTSGTTTPSAAAATPATPAKKEPAKEDQPKEELFSEDLSREFTFTSSGGAIAATAATTTPQATPVAVSRTTTTDTSDAPFDEKPSDIKQQPEPVISVLEQQEEIRKQVEAQVEAQVEEERARILQEQTSEIERLVEEQIKQRLEVERKEQQARYEELLQQATAVDTTTPVEHDEEEAIVEEASGIPIDQDQTDGVVSDGHEDEIVSDVEDYSNEPTQSSSPPSAPAATTSEEGASTVPPVTPSHPYSTEHPQPVSTPASYNYEIGGVSAATTTSTPTSSRGYEQSEPSNVSSQPSPKPATTTATKFHLGTAVGNKLFGGKIKFQAPKAPNPFKHAAFASTSKKNANRAREDIAAAFHNDLSKQAESTGRRKAMDEGGSGGETGGHHTPNPTRSNANVSPSSSNGPPHDQATQNFGDRTHGHGVETPANYDNTHHDVPASGHDHYSNNYNQPGQESSYGHGGPEPSSTVEHSGGRYENSASPTPPGHSSAPDTFTEEEVSVASAAAFAAAATDTMQPSVGDTKPSFQQPVNKTSALLANGWIEQFRRSKMRHVWKEVLASLVEARHPGEETTLWIQREIVDSSSGTRELEALHQIPMKNLEEVKLNEMSTDNQFTIKLYSSTDEFVFRCAESPVDSMRWVQILQNYQKIAKGMAIARGETSNKSSAGTASPFEEEKKGPDAPKPPAYGGSSPAVPSGESRTYTVRELRAMCHGAGINTSGMERSQLEAAADEVRRRGTYFPSTHGHAAHVPPPGHHPAHHAHNHQQQQPPPPYPQSNHHERTESTASGSSSQQSYPQSQHHQQQPQDQVRMSVKELRAICHGAGINTAGMERRELEAAADEVKKRGTYFEPPPGMHAPSTDEEKKAYEEHLRARQEEYRRQEEMRRAQAQQQQEEEARRRAEEEARRRQAEEEARRRAAAEEEARRKAAAEEEARRRKAEEEHRRRMAAEEQRRVQQQQHEAQERYRQQQAAWAKQQQEAEARRRQGEAEAAEQRRRQEEAARKQQQWASQSAAHAHHQQRAAHQQYYPQQHQQPHAQQSHHHHPQPPQYAQQQQQQQQRPQPQGNYQQQQQNQQHSQSAASAKYAKMANQSEDEGQAVITRIKHDILIHWALQPPQLQMLRPIDGLVTSIHTVFPPALGVSGHEYFSKWKPFTPADLKGTNGLPDGEKLKKSVRKIRFFLHPDKIPRDLNDEQAFMVKMLWDVTSDAWEEYQKQSEQLDWIHN
mmetsp:Transcript_14828/g.36273  ORF Transcript_14828/g.36273 Transcript_14828/m.36273 type:complete len:1323 (-) Transcript_14828:1454-5422(-)